MTLHVKGVTAIVVDHDVVNVSGVFVVYLWCSVFLKNGHEMHSTHHLSVARDDAVNGTIGNVEKSQLISSEDANRTINVDRVCKYWCV